MDSNLKLHTKILYFTVCLGGLNFLVSCWSDQEVIKPEFYPFYCIVNVFAFLISSLLIFKNYKNGFKQKYLDIFFLLVISWAIFSQFLIPAGYLTVIIGLFVYSLFNDIPLKKYICFSIIAAICAMIAVELTNAIEGITPELISNTKKDYIYTIGMITLFVNLTYIIKTKTLEKFKEMESKMIDLGSKSSVFIHDLKNKTYPLINHAKFLNKDVTNFDSKQKMIATEILSCVNDLNDFIKGFNQTFSFKEEHVKIDLKEIVNNFKKMYKNKVSNIEFEITQENDLVLDIHKIKSILDNLIINSNDVFIEKQIVTPKIQLIMKKNTLIFQDNAGGVPSDILNKIKNDQFVTTKNNGSGIGFYTIKKYAGLLKANVSFENKNNGFRVTLEFKDK